MRCPLVAAVPASLRRVYCTSGYENERMNESFQRSGTGRQ